MGNKESTDIGFSTQRHTLEHEDIDRWITKKPLFDKNLVDRHVASSKYLGLSMHYLCHSFLEDMSSIGIKETTSLHEVEIAISRSQQTLRRKWKQPKNFSGKQKPSYIDYMKGTKNIGNANFLLSCDEECQLCDLVRAVEEYISGRDSDSREIFIWIRNLCQEQSVKHTKRPSTVETLVFQREFLDLIYGVERILIVLCPQDKKKRLWSLFEIYSATTLNKVNVEFFVPTAIKEKIIENESAVDLDAIANVNVEQENTSRVKDREIIHRLIRSTIGSTAFNIHIKEVFRSRIKELIDERVSHQEKNHDIIDNGSYLYHVGMKMCELNYEDSSLCYFKKAIHAIQPILNNEGANVSTSAFYERLGFTFARMGDTGLAREMLEEAISIYNKLEKKDKAKKIGVLKLFLLEKGKKNGSRMEGILGSQDSKDLSSMSSHIVAFLNILYSDMEGVGQKYKNQALDTPNQTRGEANIQLSLTYHNLALLAIKRSDWKEAYSLLFKVLCIREATYGKLHRLTAESHYTIGKILHHKIGDFEKAIEHLQTSLNTSKHVFGIAHKFNARSCFAIALIHQDKKEHDMELLYLKRALSIWKDLSIDGEDSHVAKCYNALGQTYFYLKEYEEALYCSRAALKLRIKLLGDCDPRTASTFINLACILYEMGEYEEALQMANQGLMIEELILGKSHSQTGISYNNIACIFTKMGESDNSLQQFSKANKIFETVLGPDHDWSLTTKSQITKIEKEV